MVVHDRTPAQLIDGSGRYTHDTMLALLEEHLVEHRNLCKKERLKSSFSLPVLTDDANKSTMKEIDGHFLTEKALQKSLIDLGCSLIFTEIVKNGQAIYEASVLHDEWARLTALGGAAPRPAGAEPNIPAPDIANLFDITEDITRDEMEGSSRFYNTHDTVQLFQINFVTKDMIFNNTKADLKKKIEVQLEPVEMQKQGGPLTLWLVRKAVIRASEKHVESITKALKAYKISNAVGENVDESVRLIRSNLAVLAAANRMPIALVKILMTIFQSSSNKEFNEVFRSWHLSTIIAGPDPTSDEILLKAVEVYSSLCDDKKWIKSRVKDSAFMTNTKIDDGSDVEGDSQHGYAASSDNEGEPSSDQLKKREKNRARRAKQRARKLVQAASAEGRVETAASAATSTTLNHAGGANDEIIRTFTLDRVEMEGNIKRPKADEDHKKRVFKRTDTGEAIELSWCWTCGNRGGMWKRHSTRECPHLQRGNSPAGDRSSRDRQVRFGTTASLASSMVHPSSEIREFG